MGTGEKSSISGTFQDSDRLRCGGPASVNWEQSMSLSMRIAPHLPYLRRFSRAVTGSQTSGDAYVAATLEALIADTSIFPDATNDRIAIYKLFSALFSSSAIRIP